jgi:hypothetical protein
VVLRGNDKYDDVYLLLTSKDGRGLEAVTVEDQGH